LVGIDGYLTSADLAKLLGIKQTSVHRYRVRGDIPQPDEYVGRTPLWKQETIDQWVENRPSHSWQRGAANPRTP
jgi:predicted DNA-binding transcriptional regulator AlpA